MTIIVLMIDGLFDGLSGLQAVEKVVIYVWSMTILVDIESGDISPSTVDLEKGDKVTLSEALKGVLTISSDRILDSDFNEADGRSRDIDPNHVGVYWTAQFNLNCVVEEGIFPIPLLPKR